METKEKKPEVKVLDSAKSKAIEKAEGSIVNPGQLLEKAIEKGLEIESLEKLMDLQERWEKGQAVKAFHNAMTQFQANKPKLIKSKQADFGPGKAKYNYNPLPKIQEAVDPILSECGLSYRWERKESPNLIRITCVVSHVDGHSEETWMEAGPDASGGKNPLHAIGSARSYMKRYTLEDAFGLSSDDDDDGKASGNGQTKPTPNEIQWPKIVEKFKTGTVNLDEINKYYSLSESQKLELKKLTK